MTVTEQGRTRRIPILEVMVRQLAHDAMRSDPRAMKLLLYLADKYADPAESSGRSGEVAAEDQAILSAILEEARNSARQPEVSLSQGDAPNDKNV